MKHPFERILLATEHTEFDSGAERVAFEMARRCECRLAVIVPVVSNPEFEIVAPELAVRAEREAAAKMAELRASANEHGLHLDIHARRGEEPYQEIVLEATERKADLIVTHRRDKRSFVSNLLIGETVSKVVGHAPCDVLFVPRASGMWSHGVLAAIDISMAAEHVATVAAAIAVQCRLPLTIISVIQHDTPSLRTEVERTISHTVDAAASAGAQVRSMILLGNPFEQILGTAKTLGADLIVVGRHGESNVVRTPLGGTTQKIVGLSDRPVLVVRR
jgi:nucleotide-binding universal stress UspA family protein